MEKHEVQDYPEITSLFSKAKEARSYLETLTQEEIDKLCQAVGWEVSNLQTWAKLAKQAVEETGLGEFNSKVNKRIKIRGILRDCLRLKSVGIIEEDLEKGLVKYAKPVGTIVSLVPTTNPTLTPAGQAIFAIKARNAIIFSPHPRAKNVTFETVEIMRQALKSQGAPEDILQCVENPNLSKTNLLMQRADLIIATGGKPMVVAAHSSGKPAYGSGAGNSTVIIDETADVVHAAENTRISKTSDYGSGCSCDGNLIIHDSVWDSMLDALIEEGGYLASESEKKELEKVMWDADGNRLADTVAISPQQLALKARFSIPDDRKFIMVLEDGIGKEFPFSREKLTTLLSLFKYDGDFENAISMMQKIYEVGGKGHSCGIYSFNDDHIHRLGLAAPVSRIMVRQPQNKANAGSFTNGMPMTSSMACGTWGGNIVSENISLKHYMNTTWVARPIKEDKPDDSWIFGEFYDISKESSELFPG